MKNRITIFAMTLISVVMASCGGKEENVKDGGFKWVVDRFDDIKVLRYQVHGFDDLLLQEKKLIYYLNQAALCGRDIYTDQNFKYNLVIRRTLETIYENYDGNRETDDFKAFETYLKKVWFANGIHHHYSTDKFIPRFSQEYFDKLIAATPKAAFPEDFGDLDSMMNVIKPVIFDPELYAKGVNQQHGDDLVATSACNYYEGVTEKEVRDYYKGVIDRTDRTPISYGLNSKMVKENGRIVEKVWKVGGMYTAAIERIVYWLEKAAEVAFEPQKQTIETLISYYKSGDLKTFDNYSIQWVQDTISNVDFVNGFIETYGDPIGYRAAWEGLVNIKDVEATRRTEAISAEAQWFEDHSPIDNRFKKSEVKGVSAKVITATILGGACYPATPIGINLPNADWIRRDYGSKSVTIENITQAYNEAAKGNGFLEEFVLDPDLRTLMEKHGALGSDLHTDLHECLGHGSGQLAPGVKGDELKNYASTLEETRADLFALYYLNSDKLVEMGIIPSRDVAVSEYEKYMMNGLMTQLTRIHLGKDIEEAHMRNRKLIAEWCYEKGQAENVVEIVKKNGKSYVVINDYDKLKGLFGDLLREVQRIKSEGDYAAGRDLVERYGVKVDPLLHKEVLERYAALKLEPYSGFVNPVYQPIMKGGEIVDIVIDYSPDYVSQMLGYSKEFSFLPSKN